MNYHDRIASIPGVVGGKPIIKGTRIPVEIVLQHQAYAAYLFGAGMGCPNFCSASMQSSMTSFPFCKASS